MVVSVSRVCDSRSASLVEEKREGLLEMSLQACIPGTRFQSIISPVPGAAGVVLSQWDPFQGLTCLHAVTGASFFPAKCKGTILLSLSEDIEFCYVSKETGCIIG